MSKREFRRIKLDVNNWTKLKMISLVKKTTLENEANNMLALYVSKEKKK